MIIGAVEQQPLLNGGSHAGTNGVANKSPASQPSFAAYRCEAGRFTFHRCKRCLFPVHHLVTVSVSCLASRRLELVLCPQVEG